MSQQEVSVLHLPRPLRPGALALLLPVALTAGCGGDPAAAAGCDPSVPVACDCLGAAPAVRSCDPASGALGPCPCPSADGGVPAADAAPETGAGSPDAEADADSADGGAKAEPAFLPAAPPECPAIREGDVMFGDTEVRVWVDVDVATKGPLILYWHGTCSSPLEVPFAGIGTAGIERVKAQGGLIAAIDSPYKSPGGFCAATGLPATESCPGRVLGNGVWCAEDFDVADSVVACAIQQVGIDTRRIHTVGMSAGGVMAVAYGYARSGYLASLTSYSGGGISSLLSPTIQDPNNAFAAMIVHGGPQDVVGAANFPMLAQLYQAELTRLGHFSFVCDHGMGHTIPAGIGDHTLQFFEDHPFGVSPEPYAQGLPDSFPSYCALP